MTSEKTYDVLCIGNAIVDIIARCEEDFLLANGIASLVGDRLPLRLEAPTTVDVALRQQGDRRLVHLVNLTTQQIITEAECEVEPPEIIPVHELVLRVRCPGGFRRAFRARDGQEFRMAVEDDWVRVEIPKLELYEVVVLEP